MKLFSFSLIVLAFFGSGVAAQESEPIMKGSGAYSMPQSAIDAELGGTVLVAVRIDSTGKVAEAKIAAGPMWPCGATPTKAFDDLSSTLEEAFKKIEFTPAMDHGKPVERTIGLRLDLKNPKLVSPVEIDPATGKRLPKVISAGIMNGKARSLAKPEYPAEGRANRESGAVEVQVLVDEAGKVIRAGALNGGPHLQLPAREAACSSEFAPTRLSGNPVKVSGILTYNFVP
jgi:outer membrane biosynthesis protein TonB